MFESKNVDGEIAFLRKLKTLFEQKHAAASNEDASNQRRSLPLINGKIDELIKTEADKCSKLRTIERLIKESRKAKNCHLCK